MDFFQHFFQPIQVHGLMQHVFHHFAHQRMVRKLDRPMHVFLAGSDVGKNRS